MVTTGVFGLVATGTDTAGTGTGAGAGVGVGVGVVTAIGGNDTTGVEVGVVVEKDVPVPRETTGKTVIAGIFGVPKITYNAEAKIKEKDKISFFIRNVLFSSVIPVKAGIHASKKTKILSTK